MLRKLILPLAAAIVMVVPASCGGDSTAVSKFSKYRAALQLTGIQTIAPLTAAITSFGEYCTITLDKSGAKYEFASLTTKASVNRTGIDAYRTYICIGGFIVGRSSMTELGSAEYPLMCYDLACSNCYHDDAISKALSLVSGGRATCPRCHRTYDLNNDGLVVDGEKGRKLERYRVMATSTTLSVAN